MSKTRRRLFREFHDEEARREYADEFLDSSIALQIKALRQQRGWTQKELGERAGDMKQSRISLMEQVDHSNWSVKTLRRLAEAFDLSLVVRFESFGKLLEEILDLSRSALERPSFEDDEVFQERRMPTELGSDAESNVLHFPLEGRASSRASVSGAIGSSTSEAIG